MTQNFIKVIDKYIDEIEVDKDFIAKANEELSNNP